MKILQKGIGSWLSSIMYLNKKFPPNFYWCCLIHWNQQKMSLKKTTLTEIQKWDFCKYARDNSKKTRAQYIDWIEEQWGLRVSESTITRTLQTANKRLGSEIISPNIKRHKPVSYPEFEFALKEFVLEYQH